MTLRQKFFLMASAPLILAISAITALVTYQSRDLSESEINLFSEAMLNAKKAELLNYISLARSSINYIYKSGTLDDPGAKERVKAILNGLTYGPDGYFFVYDYNGRNLVHPKQPYREGKAYWNLKDPSGRLVIQELIKRAKKGGGFFRYEWEKPSTGKIADKIGYAIGLDKWGWMIGTGIYIDNVFAQIRASRSEFEDRVTQTFILIATITFLALLIVFITGILLNLHASRLADSKLKALTQRIINIQEEERGRVSRELHDGISQCLVGVKYALELVSLKFKQGNTDIFPEIGKCEDRLNLAIGEVRRISRDLRPSTLDDLGLSLALESLVSEFGKRTGIKTDVTTVAFKHLLPTEAKTALFRVAQEALTNVERHAKAGKVSLSLQISGPWIILKVSDNGAGFDKDTIEKVQRPVHGIGLRNMQERLEYFDGVVRISSSANGTTVVAKMPKKHLLSRQITRREKNG